MGPKVADCVALFSLDQAACIPVDTHVWRIARRDYDASRRVASIRQVYDACRGFVSGPLRSDGRAGRTPRVLLAAELPAFRSALPAAVVDEMDAFRDDEKRAAAEAREARRRASPLRKGSA